MFHKTSNVVSAIYRETVKVLRLQGSTEVIRVDGTLWISHMLLGLTNLLNAYTAHINVYNTIINEVGYFAAQKAKASGFLKRLKNVQVMSFTVFMFDVLKSKVNLVENVVSVPVSRTNGFLV